MGGPTLCTVDADVFKALWNVLGHERRFVDRELFCSGQLSLVLPGNPTKVCIVPKEATAQDEAA